MTEPEAIHPPLPRGHRPALVFMALMLSINSLHAQGIPTAAAGMVLIPAGSFEMGDTFKEGRPNELPTHQVEVSAFYMDRTEVTRARWDEVYRWATNRPGELSYDFDNPGSYYEGVLLSKGPAHPVHTLNWYDVVKWCNARSEKEGRLPAYYTSAGQTTVYRSGQLDLQNDWVAWTNGYRLPTEAEWEKAARGGTNGHRFPWADAETISHSRANYFSTTHDAYDLSAPRGFHPAFHHGPEPFTSPVGHFAPNGYGLYDMAGNVFEWCWDWYGGAYWNTSEPDPRGPALGSHRVNRGGSWYGTAFYCRAAYRYYGWPVNRGAMIGFRCVLSPAQP